MKTVRDLFDKSKPIDRRIEKVITYNTTDQDLLKGEIREYVATESIENHLDRMLDCLEDGMGGGASAETGVWVSGFYGCGKSSFTKYLGFSLDPGRLIDGKPFLQWMQNQLTSLPLRQRLGTAAKNYPSAVIMLDLASEQLAGATMAEISTVLYAKVMQWAGYSQDAKTAHLEFMLEKDGRYDEFKARISEMMKGACWDDLKNQPLSTKALASLAAPEFYPELFPNAKAFNDIRLESQLKEDDRVSQMLDVIRRKSGTDCAVFILDEVGQYVAGRDDLILNLDGLAKNIRNLGKGKAWVIATAQQTLTEDDPRAAANTASLFKLKDRFPVTVDLEASDIKEIVYKRLLGKSSEGRAALEAMFDRNGPQLRYTVDLKNTKYYKSDLDKESFCRYYPFLPHHFEILLQLLARLAKTRGGIGLRSAIKVIQDILVDTGKNRKGETLLADEPAGALANTVVFYDCLRSDIERPFPHIVNGVRKVETVFGADSIHLEAAKSVAVLQILEDFPVGRENVAALMHPAVDAPPRLEDVQKAVSEMLSERSVPLNEVDGGLRFMSEAVLDLEKDRLGIGYRIADLRVIQNNALKEIFSPVPTVKLQGARSVGAGLKVYGGPVPLSIIGEKETIQAHVQFVDEAEYEKRKEERILDSQQPSGADTIFILGRDDKELNDMLVEIYRCREIYNKNRKKAADRDVEEYLRSQDQRAQNLSKDLEARLKKSLGAGSFIFRGKPRAVSEYDADIREAFRKQLDAAASEIYDKYGEAPVQVDSGIAERFLKTDPIEKVASKNDPLGLVKKSGKTPIDSKHKAVVSICDYLEKRGQVDGRRLLDDFFAPPYGWSKDTARYIVAAMLTAGIVKLRIGGEDVTVRGDAALNNLKNTNTFNKIGIALRDSAPDLDSLLRSKDRLLTLTGDEVAPLEEDISKCVMRFFPDLQKDFSPLSVRLENLEMAGAERAQGLQDNLSEILKGDASDAANRLGGETCPLFDDLVWARDVKKAFDNGAGPIVGSARELMSEIPGLPDVDALKKLKSETAPWLEELENYIAQENFFTFLADIQNRIADIETKVEKAALALVEERKQKVAGDKKRLKDMAEWSSLSPEDKERLGRKMDEIEIEDQSDLDGIKKLITDYIYIDTEIGRIEEEIKKLYREGEPKDPGGNGNDDSGGTPEGKEITLPAPGIITDPAILEKLIADLGKFVDQVKEGATLKIEWR